MAKGVGARTVGDVCVISYSEVAGGPLRRHGKPHIDTATLGLISAVLIHSLCQLPIKQTREARDATPERSCNHNFIQNSEHSEIIFYSELGCRRYIHLN